VFCTSPASSATARRSALRREPLRAQVDAHWNDTQLLDALHLLRHAQREADAADILSRELARGRDDARLHASAGNIAMALGQFAAAREHFLHALQRGIDPNVWHVGQALAHCQRYDDAAHADLQLFERLLATPNLNEAARASLWFARAKLRDDVDDLAAAAQDFRAANAVLQRLAPWRRAAWQALVHERRQRAATFDGLPASDFRPLFVVGLPRTGSTLVVERLLRLTGVCGRGEPPLLNYIARELDALGPRATASSLHDAANLYVTHMRQDDAPARWYVDKNPLNFLHLDCIARLFPQARVIVCRRAPRDCAASIWMQFFAQADYAFANSFADIRTVHDDAEALLRHWRATLPLPLLEVQYEKLVDDIAAFDTELARFLDLDAESTKKPNGTTITSASLWQARQPVYRHALGRGERYAALLPELRAAFP
jgi:tetratricopeptide (TPR) repeat protein